MQTLSIVLAALLAPVATAGSTWYVDAAATPPGDGSLTSPYTSIAFALAQPSMQYGDTVLVYPGTYSGDIHIPYLVTVKSIGGPTVTRIVLNGTQHYGLWMDNLGATLEGFYVENGGIDFLQDGYVRNCVFHAPPPPGNSRGIFFDGACQIVNCTFVDWQWAIVEFAFSSGGYLIENDVIQGSPGTGILASPASGGSVLQYCATPVSLGQLGCFGTTDAGFWNTQGGDFHLAPLSVLIDAGNPAQTDPDGTRVDIGAIPYDASYAATPTTYCTAKTNSLGCAPVVTWTGTASLSGPDDFVLNAAPALNHKVGKFIWGTAAKAAPFAGGTLCIKLPFVRGPHLDSGGSASGLDCSGAYTWHFSQAYMASKAIPAGSILYAQAWGRDPGFADPNNSQLSDAIVFYVAP